MTSFSEILKKIIKNKYGSTLNLDNNEIGVEGAKELAEALETNTSLTTVILSNNGIGDRGAIALATALRANHTLKSLDLSNNGIGDRGANMLADALGTNDTLKIKSLNLGNNDIGDRGAIALAGALGTNKTLTTLNLTANDIGEEGAIALATALGTNKTLTSLELNNNNRISARISQVLAEALRKNILKIDMNIISSLSDFKSLAEKEKKFIMFITVNSTKYEYECRYNSETVFFLSENMKPFLTLSFEGNGNIQITGLKFKTIETLTPLDTTFYLRTFFYRMIQIDTINITDVATVSCGDKDKIEYYALAYRLFATDTPLYDLSIYSKYFTKITLDDNEKGLDLQKLLTEYRAVYSSFPKDFMDKSDCPEKASLLNDLFDALMRVEKFENFYNALQFFYVKIKDSIYYPCCKDCDGLFCVNKRYALPKYLAESELLFKHTSSHRKQSTRRVIKSKSIPKKSKRGSARAQRAIKSPSPVRVKRVKSSVRRKSPKRSPVRVKRV